VRIGGGQGRDVYCGVARCRVSNAEEVGVCCLTELLAMAHTVLQAINDTFTSSETKFCSFVKLCILSKKNTRKSTNHVHRVLLMVLLMNRFTPLLLLLLGLAAATLRLPAQTIIQTPAQADSLRRVIATAKHDTMRVNAMNKLAYYLCEQKSLYDSAMTYAQEAQKMAERAHFRKGVAAALNNKGLVYYGRHKYSEALENHFAALRIHQEIGDKSGIAASLNNVANVYGYQGKYTEELEYGLKSLRIREEIGDKSGIAASLNNIAIVYYSQGKYTEALAYYFKSLRIREEIGDKSGIAASLNNIAIVYGYQGKYTEALEYQFKSLRIKEEIGSKSGIASSLNNIAIVYKNLGKYTEALEYNFKSLRIREEIGNKSGIANSLKNIANLYGYQGKYTEALEYHFKSLRIDEEIGNKSGIAGSLTNIGIVYNETGQFKQAQAYLFQSLQLREKLEMIGELPTTLNGIAISYRGQGRFDSALVFSLRSLTLADSLRVPVPVKEALEELSIIMDSLGRHKESLAYFKRSVVVKDSLVNLESLNKSSALKEGYEAEKREQQIALLNKDKEVWNKDKALKESELERRNIDLARSQAEQNLQQQSILLLNKEKVLLGKEKDLRALTVSRQEAELTAAHAREEQNKQALALASSEQERQRAELQRRNVVQWSLAGFLVLVAAGALWLGGLYRQKNAANKAIVQQQRILEEQATEIELANTALQQANEESETLLLNILPSPIALRLKTGERAIADKFDSVTVLFADIVGFTRLSAQTSPERLVQGLNAIFAQFDALAQRYGLEKIKTIGDAYMVAGGLPEKSDDHCERVCCFALDIHEAIKEETFRTATGEIVQLRIGIHTGEAIAGVIGTSKFAYDLWGDTVNTASRMESHGEAGRIQVTEDVYEALKNKFAFEERGEIEVKGKGAIRTWFLVGRTIRTGQ
jgi:adenylate cyclase